MYYLYVILIKNNKMKEVKNIIDARLIIDILLKAQVSYSRKMTIWGSEYWSVANVRYRVSDHDKPGGQIYSGVDLRSYSEFLQVLKKRTDIDLSDKTNAEIAFKEKAKKKLRPEKNKQYGTIYRTECGAMFDSEDNALNYLWQKLAS